MKRVQNLSPSTIKRRRGALVWFFDWMVRKHLVIMLVSALRQLKRGFAAYTPADAALLAQPRVASYGRVYDPTSPYTYVRTSTQLHCCVSATPYPVRSACSVALSLSSSPFAFSNKHPNRNVRCCGTHSCREVPSTLILN